MEGEIPGLISGTQIHVVGKNPVVSFAAEELSRYLEKMTGLKHHVKNIDVYRGEEGIYLGLPKDLLLTGVNLAVSEDEKKDTIILKTVGRCLFISGSNPRSILFASYYYLKLHGAEWLWPGEDGEVLPRIKNARIDGFDIKETASYDHRGVCIEGAVTPEMVIDFVDWMAKQRLNEFFLQFKTSRYFYNRYYARKYNPMAEPSPDLSVEEALRQDDRIIAELKKRGMVVERVGHGWTCESIGIQGLGWDPEKDPVKDEQRQLLALVNGRRELFGGIAVNTELCYSNPKAFQTIVDHVVQYALEHPEVDILHFWLSDGMNNHCECPECREMSPSDWYSKLVNAVSHRLGELNCKTRIVFLCYSNTLWAPTKEFVDNKYGNTIFMFAPISRCYLHPLADEKCSEQYSLTEPPRNRIVPPRTNREFIQLLRAWQKTLKSDSFLFDYHFWFAYGFDFLKGDIGKILWQDLRDLDKIGLNGLLSCQTLRAFYPTGVNMKILAETLWNKNVSLEDVKKNYLQAAFGSSAEFVSEYLEKIYSFIDASNYEHREYLSKPENLEKLLEFVKKSRKQIEKIAQNSDEPVQKRSATILLHHNTFITLVLEAIEQYVQENYGKALESMRKALNHFLSTEDEFVKIVDVFIVSLVINRLSSAIQSKKLFT
ncbi:MAG: DUF4838 domain-containing protein [Thermoproteota archaeon]